MKHFFSCLPSTLGNRRAFWGVFLWLGMASAASAQSNLVWIVSQPGDYVGSGQVYFTTNRADISVGGGVTTINVDAFDFQMSFEGTNGIPLTIGIYSNATRYLGGTGSNPGISVEGYGRGCNYICGQFQIFELGTNANGNITDLWLTFTQYCECGSTYMSGEIRYQSELAPPGVAPSITNQPQDVFVLKGQPFSLSAGVAGTPPMSYQWLLQSNAIGGATSSTFSNSSAQDSDGGYYNLVVTNWSGTVTSAPALVTIAYPPSVATQPQSQTVGAGGNCTFSVTPGGTPPFGYQWYFDSAALDSQTNSTLSINPVYGANAGSYQVVVTNLYASATSSVATLSVSLISSAPKSVTVGAGSNATFSVTPNGVSPFYYQWLFGGAALDGQTNATLTLPAVSLTDAGIYQVVVTNLYASATSSVATLSVSMIFKQPRSLLVAQGSNVTFSVTSTGAVSFNYQWFFDGVPMSGQTAAALALNSVALTNVGSYQVVLTNDSYGSVTSSVATLSVIPPVQPPSQTVGAGSNATLSVNVYGTGPFTYQWQLRGTNLPNGIISTVAGGGSGGDGSLATNARVSNPFGVALDASGDLFIPDYMNNRIREVGSSGVITTVAGNGSNGFSGDGGPATNASLYGPYVVTVDASGNLFIADLYNNRVRKVATNGIISTVAGNGANGFSGDGGPATNASLNSPCGVAVDAYQNLFIADSQNYRVRMVDTNGIISTVAGNGSSASSSDGGAATNASISPFDVALDGNGNLFIADFDRIRMVDTNGIITTVWRCSGSVCGSVFVAADGPGNVFIGDQYSEHVWKVATNGTVTTVAGSGHQGFSGDGGPATNAYLSNPLGVAVDAYGNVFFADSGNNRIRKVIMHGPSYLVSGVNSNKAGNYDVVVTSSAGSATSSVASIGLAFGPGIAAEPQSQVAVPGGNVTFSVTASGTGPISYQWYFGGQTLANQTNSTLLLTNVNTNNAGNYQVLVSNPYASVPSSDAALTIVQPAFPFTNITVVAGSTVSLSMADVGGGPLAYQWQSNGINLPNNVITTVAGNGAVGFSGDGGAATSANLDGPFGVASDALGNLFIADTLNNRVRKVDTNGIIRTVAGKAAHGYSGDGGQATNATLYYPKGLAIDASGNVFIADCNNQVIRKVNPNGIISTVAGYNYGYSYGGDGSLATNCTLAGALAVAVDPSGNLYIADGQYRILEVGCNGIINTLAGNGTAGYSGDGGPATGAALAYPYGVTVDAWGNAWIADSANNCIRKVGANGVITTVSTNRFVGFPTGVAADAYGDLFIAGTGNSRVWVMSANGIITSIAGGGSGGDGGLATSASLNQPYGVALDANDNLLIADTYNNRVRKVVFQGASLVLTNVSTASSANYDVIVTSSSGAVTSSVVSLTVVLPPQHFGATWSADQGVQFQFSGTPSQTYVLLAATNLDPPMLWQPIATNSADTSGNWTFTDTNALNNPIEFYRAMLLIQ